MSCSYCSHCVVCGARNEDDLNYAEQRLATVDREVGSALGVEGEGDEEMAQAARQLMGERDGYRERLAAVEKERDALAIKVREMGTHADAAHRYAMKLDEARSERDQLRAMHARLIAEVRAEAEWRSLPEDEDVAGMLRSIADRASSP